MKIIFSLFVLLVITASCNSAKATIENSSKQVNTLSGTYSISQIGDIKSIPKALSITFDDSTNKVSGFAGCNYFFGTYSLANKVMTFKNIASSKKFCQKEVNQLENQLITALNSINKFSTNENLISLFENETVLLTANKCDPLKGN
jgi:heat shock protein HslJ